ncbi:unnamed protein product [Ceutorhynchus assimilis]|uniref:Thiamin pyrophosphokinase thiamin-binding domain-containing protein n=1 Tax=Ceutorhynchus assimilis TaxID=467358 RepID=A0A9N9QEA7_9CUCU|nr:unnamed protein product [Ceutorhynchus assimilis]
MNATENNIKLWSPCEDIFNSICRAKQNYAIVILNCRISLNIDHRRILYLWAHAKVRVTVDGGLDRWLTWVQAHEYQVSDVYAPDLITGDMDSLSLGLLQYFENKDSKIVKTPEQNETDFTKSLKELQKHCDDEGIEIDSIYVLADTSGRLDQILANINTLFKAAAFMENKNIYQIASTSLTWLLAPGNHKITIPQTLRDQNAWCSLIPIGEPCIVSSKGLKWNLDETKLSFGGLVSTSNTYNGEPFVTVTTDGFLVWSMGIEPLL